MKNIFFDKTIHFLNYKSLIMENLLKHEKSPYLKQHKDNPVNWLPWTKETLEKAKFEKKPIYAMRCLIC